jgi:hypothetical protein
MSSLTNNGASDNKNMSGISDSFSNNIQCDTLIVNSSFTCPTGCVLSLPNASILDTFLTSNVPLKNTSNTFTNTNTFTSTMNLTLGNTFNFNASSVANFATTSGGTSNTTMRQTTAGLFLVRGETASTRMEFQIKDASSVVDTCFYADSNTAYISSGTTEVLLSPTTINFTATTTPTMTTQPGASSNTNECASTAWTVSRLASYALLNGGLGQTYTGIHNFPTPIVTTNTTQVATTAYVKTNLGSYALLAGPQTFTGIHNFPTPATTTNTTQVATTAYVKTNLADYVALAGSQTITGFKQFSTQPIFQQGLQANQNIVCESIGGGGQQSIMVQNNSGLFIRNVAISNSINLETRTAGGANVVNLTCENGNSTTIRGSLTMNDGAMSFKDVGLGASFTQLYQSGTGFNIVPNHSSSQVALYTRTSGGALVENIRCQNGTQNLVRGSINMINDGIVFNDVGLGPNSTSMYQTGITCTITNNFNSGSVRLSTKTAGGVAQDGVYARDGNVAGLQGNSNKTVEVNGNDCTINCDNFRSNAPFECGYLQLGTPITGKTNFDIGYRWTIDGTAFTAWNTYIAPTAGNLYTIVWDGTGDTTLGLWSVEISVGTESTTTAIETLLCWNTLSSVSRIANRTSSTSKGTADFFLAQLNIIKLNFTINVTNLTGTYYLNFMSQSGAGLAINTDTSFIRFTRIA